jgi:hypothetical protein
VQDRSEVVPQAADPSPAGLSGRGLRIVSTIAGRWGVERAPGGKLVWAELERR